MTDTLAHPDLLRLIDDRSRAFRAAVASAPTLDAQVPSCPDWTLLDLALHLGGGDRFWADDVRSGTPDAPPSVNGKAHAESAPRDRDGLVAWLEESTQQLLDALRDAGPDRPAWTWWGLWQTPRTSGGIARHRTQETTVHTYDAQLAQGEPQPLPDEAALDGVEEFLFTCVSTTSPWPHEPTTFDFHAAGGPSWRLTVDGDGARSVRVPADATGAGVAVRGTASDLVLHFYNRVPSAAMDVDGDAALLDLLRDWEPED